MMPSAEDIIRMLSLEPLKGEGGYFRRTWTSPLSSKNRAYGSAIYYLLTSDENGFSAFHQLRTDEIYHFYAGDPAELHLLYNDGTHAMITLGSRFWLNEQPQFVVPAFVIQGLRICPGGRWTLLGTTMAPAFVEEDFSLASREALLITHPHCREVIESLTRS